MMRRHETHTAQVGALAVYVLYVLLPYQVVHASVDSGCGRRSWSRRTGNGPQRDLGSDHALNRDHITHEWAWS
jgi:hypothetical protein